MWSTAARRKSVARSIRSLPRSKADARTRAAGGRGSPPSPCDVDDGDLDLPLVEHDLFAGVVADPRRPSGAPRVARRAARRHARARRRRAGPRPGRQGSRCRSHRPRSGRRGRAAAAAGRRADTSPPRRRSRRAAAAGAAVSRRAACVDLCCERGEHRILEERTDRELDLEFVAHLGDDSRREQRVAAEVEEVVAGADRVEAEHLLPDRREPRLGPGRRDDASVGGPLLGAGAAARRGRACRSAVSGRRRRRRTPTGTMYAGSRACAWARSSAAAGARRVRDDVGDEPAVAGTVLADRGDGRGDVGVLVTTRLDLAELDAEAADLDLVVDAAEVLELAVRQPPGEVAGAVEAAPVGRTGSGTKRSAVSSGRLEVAARDAGAADVDLAGDADRAPAAAARRARTTCRSGIGRRSGCRRRRSVGAGRSAGR